MYSCTKIAQYNSEMSAAIVFHTLAALSYAGLALALWRALSSGQGIVLAGHWGRLGVLAGLIFQGVALYDGIARDGQLLISWSLALSAAVWLGIIVFWVESLLVRIDGLLLLLLPLGAVVCALVVISPDAQLIARSDNAALRSHLLLSLCAYGLITISAAQAILMSALDRRLHFPRESTTSTAKGVKSALGRILDVQPPLLAQEQLLFRVIFAAFIALTLAIITGSMISIALSGHWLPFDHKTVFTLLSWVTFGVLLAGRRLKGWRGRLALRYTLAGFAFILLSYTGSRFVLGVILHRI